MRKILLILSLFTIFISCTKKDNHPEVQYLADSVNDIKVLQKIEIDTIFNDNMKFLKSDKILLQTYDALQNIKIIDLNQNIIFEKKCNPKIKTYIDKTGNIFCDNMKYFYPDYKKSIKFEVIDIYKLINDFNNNLEKTIPNNDSLLTKKTKDFEKLLASKYKFKPLGRIETGNFIEEQNGQLIFYRESNFVNEFEKEAEYFKRFDHSILVDYYPSGKGFGTILLYYYQLTNKTRFKDYDSSIYRYTIDNKNYLYSKSYGLFLIK